MDNYSGLKCWALSRQYGFFSFLPLDGLLGGLGHLALVREVLGLDRLDDTDGNSLPHITHSESTEGREVRESLDAHRLRGNQVNDGSVSRLDRLGIICERVTKTDWC